MKILADSNIFIDFWKRPDQIKTIEVAAVLIYGVNSAAFSLNIVRKWELRQKIHFATAPSSPDLFQAGILYSIRV